MASHLVPSTSGRLFPLSKAYLQLKGNRGAHGSGGRTSWSGKAELGDYVAFYGFMLCYMNSVLAEIGHDVPESHGGHHVPKLILGGYSYGSLIASCLPPVELVSMLFQQVQEGSAESEINHRAEKLARDLVGFIEAHHPESLDRGRPRDQVVDSPSSPSRGLAMGGYESEAASRRISRDFSRRSLDTEKIRRSIDRTRQRILARTKSDQDINFPSTPCTNPANRSPAPTIAYLLISLILPPASGFTTMFMRPTFERRESQTQKIVVKDTSPKDEKFAQTPTCLIYGAKDLFTSSKKLQKWARERQSQADSMFTTHEIERAGHFWVEGDVDQRLQASIASWLVSLEQHTFSTSR